MEYTVALKTTTTTIWMHQVLIAARGVFELSCTTQVLIIAACKLLAVACEI